jgi:adenine-specific DNA-methyltransferase
MELIYKGKKSQSHILEATRPAHIGKGSVSHDGKRRMLIRGDNLVIMQGLLQEHGLRGKVDLVYIDPPFATNTVFRHNDERTAHVSSSESDEVAYSDTLLGTEYLEFIRERLIFLRELMSERASIYLHIDGKIGHYVKLIMDEVFGIQNFRNDITRIKCNPKNFSRRAYGNIKDLILFYTKSDEYIWNEPLILFTRRCSSHNLYERVYRYRTRMTEYPHGYLMMEIVNRYTPVRIENAVLTKAYDVVGRRPHHPSVSCYDGLTG